MGGDIIFADFNDLVKNSFLSLLNRFRNTNRYIKTAFYLAVCFVCVMVSIIGSGIRFGYSVYANGSKIAVVGDKKIISSAINIIENKVEGNNVKSNIANLKYSLTVSPISNMSTDKSEIADDIIGLSNNIVSGVKVIIGEKTYIFASGNDDIVENYLSKYNIQNAECESEFLDDIELQNGLFLSSDVNSHVGIETVLDSVPVQTVANLVTETPIEYKTIKIYSSDLVKGTSQVQCEGVNGTTKTVEQITYLNGNEIARTVLSSNVVSKPVNKVVLVGTSVSAAEAQSNIAAHNSGFVFPVSGSYRLGDAFGSGRSHKGYDILASKGTPIVAVKDGTVVRSGWYGKYGYCVDIDHGDGYVTRYGHASALLCKVGQRVSAGQTVAKVGSTGDSSGNHVHFEVIINGKRVNPAPYLNID